MKEVPYGSLFHRMLSIQISPMAFVKFLLQRCQGNRTSGLSRIILGVENPKIITFC